MVAFLGALIISDINNSNEIHSLKKLENKLAPVILSKHVNQFWNILIFIEYNNQNTRVKRLHTYKVAAHRVLYSMLNHNLLKNTNRQENSGVNEELFPHRGRKIFTQYFLSK